MGKLELDRRNTDYWTHLILSTETEIGMSKGTKKLFQEWSLLVKLNQRNHRTGNKTLTEILVRRGSKDFKTSPFKGSTMC